MTREMGRLLSVTLLMTAIAAAAYARHPVGIAYYDVDRLYDTIPSTFYDDRDYTPEGRYGWNGDRYMRKVRHIAAVIDSMALPAVALYGVENEAVVRDIVGNCREDYSYLHRTLSTRNGLDFALLYWGDRLFVRSVDSGYDYLSIEASIDGREILLILSRYSATAEHIARKAERKAERTVIVMGRTDNFDMKATGLRDATAEAEKAGMGNALLREGWTMVDRILTGSGVDGRAAVYARRWLLDSRNRPAATFAAGKYAGGYSNRLPIYIYISE